MTAPCQDPGLDVLDVAVALRADQHHSLDRCTEIEVTKSRINGRGSRAARRPQHTRLRVLGGERRDDSVAIPVDHRDRPVDEIADVVR